MRKMKILILSQYWWPENGVPQRRWTWLSKILIDAGHEVTVIAPPPHYQRKISLREWWVERKILKEDRRFNQVGPSGERIIRSGYFPAGTSLTHRAFNQATVACGAISTVLSRRSVLKSYNPDLVIGTVPALPTAVATKAIGRFYRTPYVIDLRDAWPDLLQQSGKWNQSTGSKSLRERILRMGPLQIVKWLTRKTIDHTLNHSAGIIVTSDHLRRSLSKRLSSRLHQNFPRVTTVRNVFPAETPFLKVPKIDGPADELNVLYAGTLGRAQNLENAVRAASIARAQGITVRIRFVGAGASKKALKTSVNEAGIEAIFEPRHEASDLAEFYSWADTALVHLTDWEPLKQAVPSKTYELMSARLHICGVVAGETAELIEAHSAGSVVPPEDPVALAELWVRLVRDRKSLEVGDQAQKRVEIERNEYAPGRLIELIKRATE